MPRMLTSLKFWTLAFCLLWIAIVVIAIADHPDLARAAH
jgi:hypothetical protein